MDRRHFFQSSALVSTGTLLGCATPGIAQQKPKTPFNLPQVYIPVVGSDEIHAIIQFKLKGCPIPMSMHLPWISPETLTMLLFAADTENCRDRRDARNEFAQTYLGMYITILFAEAQKVKQLTQIQMN